MSEPTESEPVGLAVDTEVCVGSGQCELLEEQVFLIDDDTGIAGVVGGGRLPLARARVVIDACPSGAISILPASAQG